MDLADRGHNKNEVYCFSITTGNVLLIENCSMKHAYICEGSEGKELIYYNTKGIGKLKLTHFIKTAQVILAF